MSDHNGQAEHVGKYLADAAQQAQRATRGISSREPRPPREPWQDSREVLLSWIGFGAKYLRVDPERGFRDEVAEGLLQGYIAELPRHLAEGSWLYLLGGKGVGKTMAMARLALAAPFHPMPTPPGTLHPVQAAYRFAPDVGFAFEAVAVGDADGATMDVALQQRIYMIDDIHRWLSVGGYVRENILAGWDAYTERRDGRGVTVVSANLTETEMDAVPQFKLGLDRARERGLILEIAGESERGNNSSEETT